MRANPSSRTLIRRLAVALAVALAMVAGPAPAAPDWHGSVTQENGVPLIANPSADPGDHQVVQAPERWRLGGENENDPLLGLITDVKIDSEGNAYLLDSHMSCIHVLAPDGRLLRTIGREGDGPGELRNARQLALLPDGKVAVMEMLPGNIVVMEKDGTPAPGIQPEGFGAGMSHFQGLAADSRGLVLSGMATAISETGATIHRTLASYDPSGTQLAILVSEEETQTGGAIRLGRTDNDFVRYWTLCADGRVAVYGPEHDYRLEFYGRSGGLERIVTRDYESLRRTDEDIAEEKQRNEELSARFGGRQMGEIDPLERDVTQVIARADGSLWVANSRGARACPEGALGIFDVLDAEGRLVRTLQINADYDPWRDNYLVRDNRLFVLKEGQMISSTMSGGGGGTQFMMVMAGRSDDGEDEEDALPFEVICYELP